MSCTCQLGFKHSSTGLYGIFGRIAQSGQCGKILHLNFNFSPILYWVPFLFQSRSHSSVFSSPPQRRACHPGTRVGNIEVPRCAEESLSDRPKASRYLSHHAIRSSRFVRYRVKKSAKHPRSIQQAKTTHVQKFFTRGASCSFFVLTGNRFTR